MVSAISVALDEARRVQRYTERNQRLVRQGETETDYFGRAPRPHEVADARIVVIASDLVEDMRLVSSKGTLALSPLGCTTKYLEVTAQ